MLKRGVREVPHLLLKSLACRLLKSSSLLIGSCFCFLSRCHGSLMIVPTGMTRLGDLIFGLSFFSCRHFLWLPRVFAAIVSSVSLSLTTYFLCFVPRCAFPRAR